MRSGLVQARHAAAALALAFLSACVSRPVSIPPPTTPAPIPVPVPLPQPPKELPPDAIPKVEPRSRQGNPPFYEVSGKRYFVLPSADGYRERGVASWYGPGFHRGRTSNGEPYDMHGMTAAHKTLPLPTYVRVTNLKNGRSVVVRVNDRGPFKDTRVIDLSHSAATKLDMIRQGTAFVEVQALTPETQAANTPAAPAGLFVQAGAFSERANAERLVQRLREQGENDATLREDVVNGRTLFRVRVGPVPTVNDFDLTVARLRKLGLQDARLALD